MATHPRQYFYTSCEQNVRTYCFFEKCAAVHMLLKRSEYNAYYTEEILTLIYILFSMHHEMNADWSSFVLVSYHLFLFDK